MPKIVFTIGYAGIKIDDFVDVLKSNNISLLVDVRSTPRSQYFVDFNDTKLKMVLAQSNIKYENWRTEFGARQSNSVFYTNGILDFEKFAQSEQFKSGIQKVKVSQEIICLLCAEIDPIGCHRGVLCSKELQNNGFDIKHIIARRNGEIKIENHNELEQRLIALHKTDLQKAYKKQNEKIGYKWQ